MTGELHEGERYTPGRDTATVLHMGARRLETHGRFFLPHLLPGCSVLDVGCGPGTITVGLAAAVAPAPVLGIDAEGDQLEHGRRAASAAALRNVSFDVASCYRLPVPDASVDRVFSHALLEHVADPVAALREARRVLRPGGVIGVCSPDWGGVLTAPPSPEIDEALEVFQRLQRHNGGDPRVGRRLGVLLAEAGFEAIRLDARYQRYTAPGEITDLLAGLLDREGHDGLGRAIRAWSASSSGAMFAEAWVSAVATAPR